MPESKNRSPRSDIILSTLAVLVVSGLCLMGAHALYTGEEQVQNSKKIASLQ